MKDFEKLTIPIAVYNARFSHKNPSGLILP